MCNTVVAVYRRSVSLATRAWHRVKALFGWRLDGDQQAPSSRPEPTGVVVGPTPQQVQAACSALLRLLPFELVCVILDMAEYHPSELFGGNHDLVVIDGFQEVFVAPRLRYLDAQASDEHDAEQGPMRVRRIKWTVESHDQGWSLYPEHHGTIRHSWTWLTASLIPVPLPTDDDDHDDDDAGERITRDHTILRNVHAHAAWSRREVVWDQNHPFVEDLNHLASNDAGAVGFKAVAWARYPGWVNHVRLVECKVVYALAL